MVHGIAVSKGLARVDLFVVRVYGEPRLGRSRKAAMLRIIPLHRSAGVITAGFEHVRNELVGADLVGQDLCLPRILHLNIIELLYPAEWIVGHPQFVSLVNERGSLQRQQHRRQEASLTEHDIRENRRRSEKLRADCHG